MSKYKESIPYVVSSMLVAAALLIGGLLGVRQPEGGAGTSQPGTVGAGFNGPSLLAVPTNIVPAVSNAVDLGSTSKLWRNLYVSGSIVASSSSRVTENFFITNSGNSVTTTIGSNFISINSTTELGTLTIQGRAAKDPVRINSSTGVSMLKLTTAGQFVLGPNTLAQSGFVVVSHPTGNTIALSFTDDTNYTAFLGRPAGTSAQMAIGGQVGTSFNAMANGTAYLSILNTGFAGFGTTTPMVNFAVVNPTPANTSTISNGGTGVGRRCDWNGTNWTIAYPLPNSTTYSVSTSTSC